MVASKEGQYDYVARQGGCSIDVDVDNVDVSEVVQYEKNLRCG